MKIPFHSVGLRNAFTLIEVVLAIFLALGILLVLLFFYQQAADLRAELIRQAEGLGTIRLVMDRLTAELRTARAHAFYQGAFIGDSRFLQFIKTDDIPRSAWRGGERVTRAQTDLRFVRYSAEAQPDGTNVALFRTEEPLIEHRTPRAQAGSVVVEDATPKRNDPLSDAIHFVRFRYFDGKAWLESWNGMGLPTGVEISLGFEAPEIDQGAETLPSEVFRRIVYLPGNSSKHPEFKVFKKLGATNEVEL